MVNTDPKSGSNKTSWKFYRIEDFGEIAETWDCINSQCGKSPILDASFAHLCLKTFANPGIRIAVGYRGPKAVAACALQRQKFWAWQTFQPSQAPLGLWVSLRELDHEELLSSLSNTIGPACLSLGITQQDSDFNFWANSNLHVAKYISTARLSVSGSFETYWGSRGKNLRQNMKRQRNRISKGGDATKFVQLVDPLDMESVVERYASLEQLGWKSDQGTAVTADGVQGRFYSQIMNTFAKKGEAVAYEYYINDQLVASDMCLLRDGILYLLKTAYDYRIEKLSPAFLMREEMFREFFDHGSVRRVEFYGRLMDWHLKWTEETRDIVHVTRLVPMLRWLRK